MTPLAWLGILAILLVIEAITVGLTTVWFAGGALVACIVSWLGGGIVVQLLLFFGVSVVLLIFTRPLAVRYMNKGVEKTNAESLLGKRAVVIQPINNLAQTGQVRINGAGLHPMAPFGGYKQSGNGREYAGWGIHDFCEVKALVGYGEA